MKERPASLLIEILLSVAMLGVFGIVLSGLASVTSRTVHAAAQETQAVALAKESLEAITAVKSTAWSSLTPSATPYVIQRTATTITVAPGADETLPGGFTRRLIISVGHRDPSGTLSLTGTEDPAVRLVTVTVSWQDRGQTRHVELVNYFTNWQGVTS